VVPPLLTGNSPRAGSRATQTDITRTIARQLTEDSVRVAIARSRQAYGLVVRRSGQFACGKIKLPWTRRADGTPLTTPLVWRTNASPPTPPRTDTPRDRDDRRDDRRGRGGRDSDHRNDRRGRGGNGSVHFDTKDKGVAPTKSGCRTVLKMLSRVITKVKCE